jgi:branched-chain amino acid transport system substrate-binding protein
MAEWAYKTKGWRTGYVLLDNMISYTKSLCGSFATRWKELAGDQALLGQDTFLNSDPSIAAQVIRITSLPKPPDLIFSVPTRGIGNGSFEHILDWMIPPDS